ncbi:hypothetical protein P7K49_015835 [Saguinus oedipus]|uniref:MAM domain-containing protein n=1 Tax=Saguinus oedipus TaxID=9490 RepID=A0ABQ9VAP7_SAGOE|nr:hypothetical protein P7K49_015835 [Saguinus oedipus]
MAGHVAQNEQEEAKELALPGSPQGHGLLVGLQTLRFGTGCTFEETSDPAVPCEYSQAQYDDFQWEQVRIHPGTRAPADLPHGSYLMVNTSQHAPGQRAHVIFQSLSENDTHCVQFSYFLYSRDGHSPGTLGVYVRVNGGPLGSAVWNMTGSHGRQWHQAELAVSTFWPNEYQVLFEALISPDRRGYMGLDDILLLSYPCAKAPHFSRLGDVEVNAGQNASFQCMAAGRAAEAERFLLQDAESLLRTPAPRTAPRPSPSSALHSLGSSIPPGQSTAPGTYVCAV